MHETPVVRDCMNTSMPIVGPGNDPFEVIRLLVKQRMPAALVIDEGRGIVGVFSEKSALQVLANTAYDNQQNGSVSSFMEPAAESITPDTDIFTVAQTFIQNDVGALAVIDDGRLVGAVSRRDLLVAMEALEGILTSELANRDKRQKQVLDPEAKEDMTPILANAPSDQRAEAMRNRKSTQARNEVKPS